MNPLTFSLLTDGSSDVVLLPILRWLLNQHLPDHTLQGVWADVRPFACRTLSDKIARTVEFYPSDILFVHRDAEKEPKEHRYQEIQQALERMSSPLVVPVVCVVPVRMQEAWLLFDLLAIRHAANNPNGRALLNLPQRNRIEELVDPKENLYALLRQASGMHGRRLRAFSEPQHARRVADYIEDYAPLRLLPAFAKLEEDLVQTLQAQGWI